MKPLVPLLFFFLAATSTANVLDASNTGFTIEHEVVINGDRATVWQIATDEVGQWWSDDHTIGGDARGLHIETKPMGCFCEYLGDEDGVVHLIVTSVSTDVLLRMTGGLGPLGLMGVDGNMTWEFFDAKDGTRVRFVYAVGGYSPDGLDTIADAVDNVIGEALGLLKAYAEEKNRGPSERD